MPKCIQVLKLLIKIKIHRPTTKDLFVEIFNGMCLFQYSLNLSSNHPLIFHKQTSTVGIFTNKQKYFRLDDQHAKKTRQNDARKLFFYQISLSNCCQEKDCEMLTTKISTYTSIEKCLSAWSLVFVVTELHNTTQFGTETVVD